MLRRAALAIALLGLVLLAMLAVLVGLLSEGVGGERHLRGEVARAPMPAENVAARVRAQARARARFAAAAEAPAPARQILFGDLHVHTTYSADAFAFSLPLLQGEGVHPPADACDFARFCAELDFWSINDHAEHLTPWQWAETQASIRECNAVAGDAADPDLVAFLGWEWTQSAPAGSPTAGERTHYGHKNVILRETAPDRVPARPIGAGRGGLFDLGGIPGAVWPLVRAGMTLGDWPSGLQPYLDFNRFTRDVRALPACDAGVPVRELPADCLEGADTPDRLFAKLDEWGFDSLVIPHGTAWGVHAPPEADFADQLTEGRHDPMRQRLLEVYSGHGNSELWRSLRDSVLTPDGDRTCAPPTAGYEPCCWRAGELIRARCEDRASSRCDERVARARAAFLEAGPVRGFDVVAGAHPAEWGECGQLTGTFLPAYDYRPRMSAQYALARRPAAGVPLRAGLVGSSDNHKARAGAGYKEIGRKAFGDAYGLREDWLERLSPAPAERDPEPRAPDALPRVPPLRDPGTERNASFYYTSGLVAVHAEGRHRDAIWEALRARRAYGTSGPRILLWFDLLNGPAGAVSMGGEVIAGDGVYRPRFRVRATGAAEQRPGCPDATRERLGAERLERLCLSECHHPGDTRTALERIEVVRIRPQAHPGEPLRELVEDPWRVFPCARADGSCEIEFEDPDFDAEREHLYYVRALQVPTPAVNGDPMRCRRDAEGRCAEARLCPAGGPEFDPADECLAPVRERAWSSPIWLLPRETDSDVALRPSRLRPE